MVISIYTPFPGRPCSFVATFALFETHALLVLSALLWTFRSHAVRRSLDSSHSLSDLLDFFVLAPKRTVSRSNRAPLIVLPRIVCSLHPLLHTAFVGPAADWQAVDPTTANLDTQ